MKQDKAVSEIKRMLGAVKKDSPVDQILVQIDKLNTAYQALNIDEQIKNNQGSLVLSDKNIVEITDIVEELRISITQ